MTSDCNEASVPLFKDGLSAGWPICLGYLPIGLTFGVLAQKAGLSPIQIGLMSILVFAGSSQFITVSMISAGASAAAIITTTFVVNLRHVLMSSALAVFLRSAHRGLLALCACGVTDGSFAVNLPRFNAHNWSLGRALVVNPILVGRKGRPAMVHLVEMKAGIGTMRSHQSNRAPRGIPTRLY
jgi:predicted branched-subunit amino acid permease